jgi:hypothetical protein
MLLYTFTLQAGDTIQGGPAVKADTLLRYLQAASAYVRLISRRDACPLLDPVTQKRHGTIETLIKHVRKWEALPNRRSPVTTCMIQDLHKTMQGTHQDSKHRAFYDWLIICAQTGFRRSEWVSERSIKNLNDFPKAKDPLRSIYECLSKDIVLYDQTNSRIPNNELVAKHPRRTPSRLHCDLPIPKKWRQWPKNRLRRQPQRPQNLR